MNRLIVQMGQAQAHIDSTLPEPHSWVLVSANGEVLSEGAGTLETIIEQARDTGSFETIVIAPTSRVQVKRVGFSSGQQRHLTQVIPFLLEEQLAQAPEELHYTLLTKSKSQAWVAVVSRTDLGLWLSELQSAGIENPIILPLVSLFLPDVDDKENTIPLLIEVENHWCWIESERVLVLPDVLLERLPLDQAVRVSCHRKAFELVQERVTQPVPEALWDGNVGLMERTADMLAANKTWLRFNMCHGIFGQTNNVLDSIKPWRWVAIFAFLATALELSGSYYDTTQLELETSRIQQKANALFLQLVPEEGRVVNLERQLKGRLQNADNNVAKSEPKLTPYDVMAKLDKARSAVPGDHRLIRLDYGDNQYRLEWQAGQRETVEALQKALTGQGLSVLVEQVAKRGEAYNASIRIRNTGENS